MKKCNPYLVESTHYCNSIQPLAHDKSPHYSVRNLADTCVPARTQKADNKPWAMGQLECLVESQNSSDSEEASGPGGISVRKSNQSAKTPPTMARCNKAVHCTSDSNFTSLGQYKKNSQDSVTKCNSLIIKVLIIGFPNSVNSYHSWAMSIVTAVNEHCGMKTLSLARKDLDHTTSTSRCGCLIKLQK